MASAQPASRGHIDATPAAGLRSAPATSSRLHPSVRATRAAACRGRAPSHRRTDHAHRQRKGGTARSPPPAQRRGAGPRRGGGDHRGRRQGRVACSRRAASRNTAAIAKAKRSAPTTSSRASDPRLTSPPAREARGAGPIRLQEEDMLTKKIQRHRKDHPFDARAGVGRRHGRRPPQIPGAVRSARRRRRGWRA